jgi:hypothetical protein
VTPIYKFHPKSGLALQFRFGHDWRTHRAFWIGSTISMQELVDAAHRDMPSLAWRVVLLPSNFVVAVPRNTTKEKAMQKTLPLETTHTNAALLAHPVRPVSKKAKIKKEFPDAVRNPDLRLCQLLAGLAVHYYKAWCFPSQLKILELFQRFFGVVMSRRTLNRHLAGLERDGRIFRQRRHEYHKKKGLVLHSTLYKTGTVFLNEIKGLIKVAIFWGQCDKKEARIARSGVHVPSSAQYKTLPYKGYVPST